MIEIEKAVKIAFNKEKKSAITVVFFSHSFIDSFIHLFVRSFVRSFVHSFFLSSFHSFTTNLPGNRNDILWSLHLCKRNPLQKCC